MSPASQHSFEGQKTREVGYPMSHVSACAPPGEQVCVRVVLFTRMTAFTRSQKFGGLVQVSRGPSPGLAPGRTGGRERRATGNRGNR